MQFFFACLLSLAIVYVYYYESLCNEEKLDLEIKKIISSNEDINQITEYKDINSKVILKDFNCGKSIDNKIEEFKTEFNFNCNNKTKEFLLK